MAFDLRFEPGLRIPAIKRIPVGRLHRGGIAQRVTSSGGALAAEPSEQFRARGACEFQTVDAKAQFAVGRDRWFPRPASRASRMDARRPPPVGLQARIEISVIAEIDAFFQALVVIHESAILRGRWIEEQQTQASGLLAAGRKIENQALNRERRLALPQIVEPDQPERENAIGVTGIRRGADGRPRRRTLPQRAPADRPEKECVPDPLRWSARRVCRPGTDGAEIAGTARGIRAGRCAAARCRGPRAARSISSRVPVRFPKRCDLSTSLPRVSCSMAVTRRHQIAPLVPGLQLGAGAARFQHEIFRSNREPFLARLAQHGILAGFEKALDGAKDFRRQGLLSHSCVPWLALTYMIDHCSNKN